jgi:hypothetical protein
MWHPKVDTETKKKTLVEKLVNSKRDFKLIVMY